MTHTAQSGDRNEVDPRILSLPTAEERAQGGPGTGAFLLRRTDEQNLRQGRTTKYRLGQTELNSWIFRTGSPLQDGSVLPRDARLLDICQDAVNLCEQYGEEMRLAGDEGFADFRPGDLTTNQKGKVVGDLFDMLIAGTVWDAVAEWNTLNADLAERAVICKLERDYVTYNLLGGEAREQLDSTRLYLLHHHDVDLPSSSPDMLLVRVGEEVADQLSFDPSRKLTAAEWSGVVVAATGALSEDADPDRSTDPDTAGEAPLAALAGTSPLLRTTMELDGHLSPNDFLLGIASKSSLRSDRQYQPIMEAMILQMIVEGVLGARRVDFDVFAGEKEGADAESAYRAVSLHSLLAPKYKPAHRAVRELYLVGSADDVARRIHDYLESRLGKSGARRRVSLARVSVDSADPTPPSTVAVLDDLPTGESTLALFIGREGDDANSPTSTSARGLRARLRELRRADRTLLLQNSFADLVAEYTTRTRRLTFSGLAEAQLDALFTAWGDGGVELLATYRTNPQGRSGVHEIATGIDPTDIKFDGGACTLTTRLEVPEEAHDQNGLSPRQWSQLELRLTWGAAAMTYLFDAKITRKMAEPQKT